MSVKERPMLFTASMVRALLDGSKSQTRRLVKDLPPWNITEIVPDAGGTGKWLPNGPAPSGRGMASGHWRHCPHGQPGDRLWVRETHRAIWGQSPGYLIGVDYRADPQEKWERMRDHAGRPQWTPSIHMRREYSRILLEIVSVRAERLEGISDEDCLAEGVHAIDHQGDGTYYHYEHTHADPGNWCSAAAAYQHLWETINGVGSWAANPWVWVIEFKRVAP